MLLLSGKKIRMESLGQSSSALDSAPAVPAAQSGSAVQAANPETGGFTRRAFATGAACAIGSIFLEPVLGLGNTFWLPGTGSHGIADGAYADETNTVSVDPGKFCVIVYDAAAGTSSVASGVKVHIKSLYNNQEVEGTSGSDGRIMFDVEPLARKMHSDQAGDFMEFDAAITVTADGHREVNIPCMHIMDGLAIQVPTRALDGKPYFRTLSFDDWDIQYNEQEFVLSPSNDAKHDLKCELFFPADGSYTIKPVIGKSATDSRVGTALADAQKVEGKANEFKTVTFTDQFLLTTRSGLVLEPGDVASLEVRDSAGNVAFTAATGFGVFRAPCDEGFKQANDTMSPVNSGFSSDSQTSSLSASGGEGGEATLLNEGGTGLRQVKDQVITLPDDSHMLKCLRGLQFSCWTPGFPIVLRYDPTGHIMFGLDLELLNYTNAPDEYDGNTAWRSMPRGSVANQLARKIQFYKNKFNETAKMVGNAINGKKITPQATKEITLTISFQLIAEMNYDSKEKKWEGDFGVVLGGKVGGSYTQPFTIVCIPMYVCIELSLEVAASLSYNISADCSDLQDPSKPVDNLSRILSRLKFNPAGTASLAFNLALAATLGVGIHKVLSAGVRASGGLSFTFEWRQNADTEYKGKPDPRLIFGAQVDLSVFVEVLFFKKSLKLADGKWPKLYDSDEHGSSTASLASVEADCAAIEARYDCMSEGGEYYISGASNARLAADDVQDDVDAGDFVIVSESELAARAEVIVSTGRAAATATATSAAGASLAAATGAVGAAGDDAADASAGDSAGGAASAASAAAEPLRAAAFSADEWTVTADNIVTAAMTEPAATAAYAADVADAATAAAAAAVADGAASAAAANGDSDLAAATAVLADGYTYTWTEGHDAKFDDRASGDDVIYKLGSRGGVLPRHMDLVAKDVFSASKSKLIEVNGTRYLFRIAPVTYDGKTLGRVVYQSITDTAASKPFPVAFDASTIGVGRDSLYDYDFDVRISTKDAQDPRILLLIISGERPAGDETTIFDAAEATVATAVRLGLRDAASAATQGAFVTKGNVSWKSPTYEETKQYYAFRKPYLVVRNDVSSSAYERIESDGYDHEFGFFLVDRADTKEELLDIDRVKTGMSIAHFAFGDKSTTQLLSVNMPTGTHAIVPDCAQAAPSDPSAIFATFGFTVNDGSGVRSLKLVHEKGEDGCNKMTSAVVVPVIDVDPYVKRLSPWESAQSLVASVSTDVDVMVAGSLAYLALATLPSVDEIENHVGAASGFATFDISCVSPEQVPLGDLHIREGHKYCYYEVNHSGLRGYDYEDGQATPHVEDPIRQIKALALVDGVFTQSFIFAECDTEIDSFLAVEDANEKLSTSSFVVRHVTEADSSKADLYSFDVPFLRSIATTAVSSVAAAVGAGQANSFAITVKNTGNMVLTQAKLEFTDAETGKLIGDAVLNFKEAKNAQNSGLYEDIYHSETMSDAAKRNILVAENGDAALVPGQERTFMVSIDIPADWSGKRKLTVTAPSASLSYVDPDSGEVTVDGSGVAVYGTTENNSETVELTIASAVDNGLDGKTLPGDVTPGGDGGSGDSGSGSGDGSGNGSGSGSDGGAGSGSGSGSSKGAAGAKTGDGALGSLTPALAAVAAAGAGFAAYSARRSRLEREAAEGAQGADSAGGEE